MLRVKSSQMTSRTLSKVQRTSIPVPFEPQRKVRQRAANCTEESRAVRHCVVMDRVACPVRRRDLETGGLHKPLRNWAFDLLAEKIHRVERSRRGKDVRFVVNLQTLVLPGTFDDVQLFEEWKIPNYG